MNSCQSQQKCKPWPSYLFNRPLTDHTKHTDWNDRKTNCLPAAELTVVWKSWPWNQSPCQQYQLPQSSWTFDSRLTSSEVHQARKWFISTTVCASGMMSKEYFLCWPSPMFWPLSVFTIITGYDASFGPYLLTFSICGKDWVVHLIFGSTL